MSPSHKYFNFIAHLRENFQKKIWLIGGRAHEKHSSKKSYFKSPSFLDKKKKTILEKSTFIG